MVATNRDALVEKRGAPGYVLVSGRIIERQNAPMSVGPPRSLA